MLQDISPRKHFRHPMFARHWSDLETFSESKIRLFPY